MSSYSQYDGLNFERKVSDALGTVRQVLDNTRNPRLPKDVSHKYDDKYSLAEFAVKGSIAAALNVLDTTCGLHVDQLTQLRTWSKTKTVTLEFKSSERCEFDRTESRDEKSATKHVVESTGIFGGKSTSSTVTTITEHFWRWEMDWSVRAYAGTGADSSESLVLISRKGTCETKSTGREKRAPAPEMTHPINKSMDLSWFLSCFTNDSVDFSIDRSSSDCHTPRRNRQSDAAIVFFEALSSWCQGVRSYFANHRLRTRPSPHTSKPLAHTRDVFSPVLGMFTLEERDGHEAASSPTSVLSSDDYNKLLAEHSRQLQARMSELSKEWPAAEEVAVYTLVEVGLVFGLDLAGQLCVHGMDALSEVENMLRAQVVAAIGKEVGPDDLTKYMEFHCRALLQEEFQPRGFCYSVRRPDHYPEGTLSLEYPMGNGGEAQRLVRTVVHSTGHTERALSAAGAQAAVVPEMRFALDAATTVTFTGERHLHACVLHQFSSGRRGGGISTPLRLRARARQFSSFVLLVGKIASAEVFEPSAALIIRDKDDLDIPLMLETMPTPKEFRDAIESLSPEQQRFCKAFRAMQLASTLFGVCVIQIKPQLERLLNLLPDSLTKEIALTNDLMDLFITYQIPSDLISFAGEDTASGADRLACVKTQVAALMDTIAKARAKELADEAEEVKKAMMEARVEEEVEEEEELGGSFSFGGAPRSRGGIRSGGGGGDNRRQKKSFKMMNRSMNCSVPQQQQQMAFSAAPMMAPMARSMSCESAAAPPAPPACAPVAAALETSVVQPQSQQKQQQPLQQADRSSGGSGDGGGGSAHLVDYTTIPTLLDKRCEALDSDNALRPTTIKTGEVWNLKFQKGLLSKPESRALPKDKQDEEKAKAFDLLDALSRSGSLSVESASLHVLLAATHCFDDTLMDTVVQKNVNAIERVEQSLLIVAGVVHSQCARDMLQPAQLARVADFAPQLLAEAEGPAGEEGEGE